MSPPMDKYPLRPKTTDIEVLKVAALATIVSIEGLNETQTNELIQAIIECYEPNLNGYYLTKKIDQAGYAFNFDGHLCQAFEYLDDEVIKEHRQACYFWSIINNIQPPYKKDTKITQGVICFVDPASIATYVVRGPAGCDEPIYVKFEDAILVEGGDS